MLALVKIQEEVELAREKDPWNKTNDGQPGSNDKGDKDGAPVPKFTRSTARALNKKPLPLSALSEIQLEPEIAALISDELHSDEEDEEYEPKEEDYAVRSCFVSSEIKTLSSLSPLSVRRRSQYNNFRHRFAALYPQNACDPSRS